VDRYVRRGEAEEGACAPASPLPCAALAHTSSRSANEYNDKQAAKYEKSAFGGVDLWLVLGILAFVLPFGGIAVGLATGAIHTG
jgi:hypothetical protein